MDKKRFAQWKNAYYDSEYDALDKAYKSCSTAKKLAWANCENIYNALKGCGGMRIIGKNSSFFTVAFKCTYGVYNFCVITAFSVYLAEMVGVYVVNCCKF